MDIKNLVTLIKAGYKASEIKDMEHRDIVIDLLNNGVSKEDMNEYVDLALQQDAGGDKNGRNEEETEEAGTDYKRLYEDLLKQTQDKNTREDISGKDDKKDAYTILKDFLEG